MTDTVPLQVQIDDVRSVQARDRRELMGELHGLRADVQSLASLRGLVDLAGPMKELVESVAVEKRVAASRLHTLEIWRGALGLALQVVIASGAIWAGFKFLVFSAR